jgi:2-polyprenyl-3-methyl-5-hydroxy-6-metoxy-1,4-benzoquinol methylase
VIDIGCAQGELVKVLLSDGYDACGVDISQEQVELARGAGLSRVRHGDYREALVEQAGRFAAITATDFLEHLTKSEVLETLDRIIQALIPGGSLLLACPTPSVHWAVTSATAIHP